MTLISLVEKEHKGKVIRTWLKLLMRARILGTAHKFDQSIMFSLMTDDKFKNGKSDICLRKKTNILRLLNPH